MESPIKKTWRAFFSRPVPPKDDVSHEALIKSNQYRHPGHDGLQVVPPPDGIQVVAQEHDRTANYPQVHPSQQSGRPSTPAPSSNPGVDEKVAEERRGKRICGIPRSRFLWIGLIVLLLLAVVIVLATVLAVVLGRNSKKNQSSAANPSQSSATNATLPPTSSSLASNGTEQTPGNGDHSVTCEASRWTAPMLDSALVGTINTLASHMMLRVVAFASILGTVVQEISRNWDGHLPTAWIGGTPGTNSPTPPQSNTSSNAMMQWTFDYNVAVPSDWHNTFINNNLNLTTPISAINNGTSDLLYYQNSDNSLSSVNIDNSNFPPNWFSSGIVDKQARYNGSKIAAALSAGQAHVLLQAANSHITDLVSQNGRVGALEIPIGSTGT
ncbi:MAG: hypothetical protein M1812_000939 [Candelaria pacifica]|nr:MAG: hypothetical protein M1812_000939 [Candelaria pacifica]